MFRSCQPCAVVSFPFRRGWPSPMLCPVPSFGVHSMGFEALTYSLWVCLNSMFLSLPTSFPRLLAFVSFSFRRERAFIGHSFDPLLLWLNSCPFSIAWALPAFTLSFPFRRRWAALPLIYLFGHRVCLWSLPDLSPSSFFLFGALPFCLEINIASAWRLRVRFLPVPLSVHSILIALYHSLLLRFTHLASIIFLFPGAKWLITAFLVQFYIYLCPALL